MKEKILLVDDERDIVEFLEYNLSQEGFDVVTAFNGEEAIEKMNANPSLVILDVMMPKMDGYQACSRIRSMPGFESIPIMFLTAKSTELDEVHGLNIGADDYIQKPVSPKKLIARVKSNLRKLNKSESGSSNKIITIGPLEIDREKYKVLVDNEDVVFPKKEFEILSYLASQPGKVFPREKILSDVWGNDIYVVERTIDVHVRKIREKLGEYADIIETVKGVGYRFKNFE
ncbi:MAG: response regulator transcription factor [Melioribacteraceae bacterium]|nr:MAG: response regulator transcription factor [Melioribacteraceae bacterium]